MVLMPLKPSAKIKQIPEDFVVEEITADGELLEINKKYKFQENSKGKFLHCVLVKKGIDTISAIDELSGRLKIDHRRIGFAGTKDKQAVTCQKISIMDVDVGKISKMKTAENIELIPIYYSTKKSFLGDLKGNRFTITIRDIEWPKEKLADHINNTISKMAGKFPNYFGEQRFGTGTKATTHLIGKAILDGKFVEAVKLYGSAKIEITEEMAISYLKQIPLSLRKMFIHAYQSYLFNAILERMLADGKKPEKLPLIGFDYKPLMSRDYDPYVSQIMRDEKLDIKKFRIGEFPELLSKTELRTAFQEFHNFGILKIEKDDLNKNKLKCILQFALPKSSYATVFLKELFSL